MVTIAAHARRMGEADEMSRRITPEFVKRRGAHLKLLEPIEDIVREICALPISYDVSRAQPPYFNEFTYTEMLGCFVALPQSNEVAARVVQASYDDPGEEGFDAVGAIMARPQMDKYTLSEVQGPMPKRVVFLPGTNVFSEMVSRELLTTLLIDYPDNQQLMLKPHPMTNEGTLRQLGMLAGYHRIISPMASGWAYLQAAEHVYYTTATEMGLYAALLGKRIGDVSQIRMRSMGVFAPFYRLLKDLEPAAAGAALRRVLNSNTSGFVHPADPQVRNKLKASFDLAMRLREPFKPLAHEYDPNDYAIMVRGLNRKNEDAVRPSGPEGRSDPAVAPSSGSTG